METKLIKIEGTADQITRALKIVENRGCKWLEFDEGVYNRRLEDQRREIDRISDENRELKQRMVDMQDQHMRSVSMRAQNEDWLERNAREQQNALYQKKMQQASPWHNASQIPQGMVFDVITSRSASDTGKKITNLVAQKKAKGLELIEILQSATQDHNDRPYIITTLIYK